MRSTSTALLVLMLGSLVGCPGGTGSGGAAPPMGNAPVRRVDSVMLRAVDFTDPIHPATSDQPIVLRGARNEWTSFTIQLDASPSQVASVRVHPPQGAQVEGFQILPMPVEVNPGYVRHTGLNTAKRNIPRALLPLSTRSGSISLATRRDPQRPAMLWVDLHVPTGAQAGEYEGSCEVVAPGGAVLGTALPIHLTVYDFTLPDERHLQLVGQIGWDRLGRLYPEWFGDTITPSLINRRDPRYEKTVKMLDQLVSLAERNRVCAVVPALRPTVKWPGGEPPQIYWREFDSLIEPWMTGRMFEDHVPLKYWPIPEADNLKRYDPKSRLDYWQLAAAHFDQRDWLADSAISLEKVTPGASTPDEAAELSREAAKVLAVHPRVRVTLPLEEDQIQLADASHSDQVRPSDAPRILAAAPALVSAPRRPWPDPSQRPTPWLRTDLPGLVPYIGAGGDERDVRVWAWLAFLRNANLVLWHETLPASDDASQPLDPNELAWFYPGSWFGTDEPVPTIQLKWLRRSQQDFEYLWLARQRGEVLNAMQMARLITKPVEIQPGQAPDPVYSLMSGTTDQREWDDAQALLAKTILLRPAGERPDPTRQHALYIETLQWAQPQERPLLMGRAARWSTDKNSDGRHPWLNLHLDLDIYNASDVTPGENALQWAHVPDESGWEVHPQPTNVAVPQLQTYHVERSAVEARFDLGKVTPAAREPVQVNFINGFTKVATPLKLVLPVAASDRREGPLALDGRLNDWSEIDAIQDGPLVAMMSRPNLQKGQLRYASVPAKIYTAWARDHFYLAFSLHGLAPDSHQAHNEVYYQSRRAWGEDLCEVLIQPVYDNNVPGPVLHVVCKPNGAQWVQRKSDGKWETVEGGGVRYAVTTPQDRWRGEVAIPWKLIDPAVSRPPALLRFNFSQHRAATCESASWCGPVDFGRDDRLMGILYLRTPPDVGLAENAARTDESSAQR